VGSVGISLMGNFQNDVPTKSQMITLIKLIDVLAKKYQIDPLGEKEFHGQVNSNILGHKDLAATACPGENLYDKLNYVRQQAMLAGNYAFIGEDDENTDSDYAGKLISTIREFDLTPTNSQKIVYKFKNTGKKTWMNNTWLFVFGNPQEHIAVKNLVEGKNFVAADLQEKEVRPGETGSFEVEIMPGYKEGFYTFEFAPVVNGKYKINTASIVQPLSVDKPIIDYELVEFKKPAAQVIGGQNFNFWIDLKNTGNVTWYNERGDMFWNAISLGTEKERDHASLFKAINPSRLAFLEQEKVKPGEVGRFVFDLTAPLEPGVYQEYFTPVLNNVLWLKDKNLFFQVKVIEPHFKFRLSKLNQRNIRLPRGEEREVTVNIKNIGNFDWDKDKISFKIIKYTQNIKIYDPKTGVELKSLDIDQTIKPQQDAVLKFLIKTAPATQEINSLKLLPKYEGRNVFQINIPFWVYLEKLNLQAKAENLAKNYFRLKTGEEKLVVLSFQNTGNIDWRNDGENYVYLKPENTQSPFYLPKKWESNTVATRLKEKIVRPGEFGTFEVWIGSQQIGEQREKFRTAMAKSQPIQGDLIEIRANVYQTQNQSQNSAELVSQNISKEGVNVSQTSDQQIVRVKLSFPGDEVIIGGTGSFKVTDLAGNNLYDQVGNEVKISLAEINLTESKEGKIAQGMRFIPQGDTVLEIVNWDRRPSWAPQINDNQFRGIIELRIMDNQVLVINELPLHDYLLGLAELPNNEQYEKQKAIAVLARTYALFYLDPQNRKFPGQPYDASDDPAIFQKYLGYNYEQRTPRFSEAVNETKGEVVTYQGKLVKTPYFSQSDGRTRSAEEVWGWLNTPYLQSVPDPYCVGMEKKGHGVGLSGYGARKAAEEGKNYVEIIKYYYQGVEVERM
jgi:hypothetical protein